MRTLEEKVNSKLERLNREVESDRKMVQDKLKKLYLICKVCAELDFEAVKWGEFIDTIEDAIEQIRLSSDLYDKHYNKVWLLESILKDNN